MITEGKCEVVENNAVRVDMSNDDQCLMFGDNSEDNAELICGAFNVYNETGFTPSQLAEQKADLLAACKVSVMCDNSGGDCNNCPREKTCYEGDGGTEPTRMMEQAIAAAENN